MIKNMWRDLLNPRDDTFDRVMSGMAILYMIPITIVSLPLWLPIFVGIKLLDRIRKMNLLGWSKKK